MSNKTSIQWADSTVNPIMGCGGCELFPAPAQIFLNINQEVGKTGHKISSRSIYEDLVAMSYGVIDHPLVGHKNVVNTTNIWHLRSFFLMQVLDVTHDDFDARDAAERAIKQSITCYAAVLHLNKGQNLKKPRYNGQPGYAPIFESITQFPGRAKKTAGLKDLLGIADDRSPWKASLPRLIFVSDMGDAMSGLSNFSFLKKDLIPAITSENGKRHLWLWLTKRPSRLADFAEEIGGLPENVCAMTTLTESNEKNLRRLADLKKVKAHTRGLSIEPLRERIQPKNLDLKGIDWVILGGESGSLEYARPFALEWAEEIRDHCSQKRVAFFLKQLGRNPIRNNEPLELNDSHGGEWDEWPDEALKIREFPKYFHNYRKLDMKHPKKSKMNVKKLPPPTIEEKVEFDCLHEIVKKGMEGYIKTGLALIEIHGKKLWRAGNYKSWKDYCDEVLEMSNAQACRLMKASKCTLELQEYCGLENKPQNESQARALTRLKTPGDRLVAWEAANLYAEDSDCHMTAKIINEVVDTLEEKEEKEENEDGVVKVPPPRSNSQLAEVFAKLQTAIKERSSWENVEKLISKLEKLIR